MKILIRVVDDWGEIYVNGKFMYDGLWKTHRIIQSFIQALADVVDIELRLYEGNSVVQLDKNGKIEAYDVPLHVMTEKNYWSDWDKAETIDEIVEDEDE